MSAANLKLKARKLLYCMSDEFTRKSLLRFGVAASSEHENILRQLNPDQIVDIGANKGQFALAAQKECPNAQLICFEPLPAPAAKFKSVFEEKKSKVRLFVTAIGEEKSSSKIHVSNRDDSSSLLAITKLQTKVYPGTDEAYTINVDIAPMSDFSQFFSEEGNNLLKIDVQGYELKVLKGCQSLLKRFKNVYVELSFVELYEGQAMAYEVIEWLSKRDFKLCGTYNLSYDKMGKAIQGDFLFERV